MLGIRVRVKSGSRRKSIWLGDGKSQYLCAGHELVDEYGEVWTVLWTRFQEMFRDDKFAAWKQV